MSGSLKTELPLITNGSGIMKTPQPLITNGSGQSIFTVGDWTVDSSSATWQNVEAYPWESSMLTEEYDENKNKLAWLVTQAKTIMEKIKESSPDKFNILGGVMETTFHIRITEQWRLSVPSDVLLSLYKLLSESLRITQFEVSSHRGMVITIREEHQ